jgi:hypothetical protein
MITDSELETTSKSGHGEFRVQENHENIGQENRTSGQDSNPRLPSVV